jgi:hypothetical protein
MNFIKLGKEDLIKQFLISYNIKTALIIYEIISYNPISSVIQILCVKLGLNKTIIMLILAFLL